MPPVQPVIREHPFLPCSSAAKKNPVQPVIPEHPAHYEL